MDAPHDKNNYYKGLTMYKLFFSPLLFLLSGCIHALPPEPNALEEPPQIRPYTLPTFNDQPARLDTKIKPLTKAPLIDADALFTTIINCYPTVSKWKIDLALKAGSSTKRLASDLGTDLGRNYVQIVASIPLYSTSEVERSQDREYKRREATSLDVAKFVKAIADRNHSIRELSLYQSLEGRASLRVTAGFISASEQISYLEKVAKAQESLIRAEADIMGSRISLAGVCRADTYNRVNNWLKRVSAVPKLEGKPPFQPVAKVEHKPVSSKKEEPVLKEWARSLGVID